MDTPGSALHSALVGAFRPYLKAILAERGLPPLNDEIVAEALEWLDVELASLLGRDFLEQRRSPLELVQEAMAGPNRELAGMGVKPPLRDPVAVAALPGDAYGLAPASSAALGETVFQTHLAWGIHKARVLAPLVSGQGRRVIVVSGDLIDRSRFEDAVNSAGMQLEVWEADTAGSGFPPVVAFVDLTHRDAESAIRVLAAADVKVVAYGPHVDEDALARAALLGADPVLPRSQLFKSIGDYLPHVV